MNARFWGGLVLVAAGAIATLRGHFGWGFLAFVAGFCLALGRFTGEALNRYGGALVAACLGVVLLMPLHDGRRAEPPPAPTSPPRPTAEAPAEPSRSVAGLIEQARRDIFREVALARTRAEREAIAANPDGDSISPANPEKDVRRAQKRQRLARVLEEKHLEEIAARHHLTGEQVAEIVKEGLARGWDRP